MCTLARGCTELTEREGITNASDRDDDISNPVMRIITKKTMKDNSCLCVTYKSVVYANLL